MADPVAAPQAPAQAAPMARQPAAAEVRVAYDRADALSRQIFWSDHWVFSIARPFLRMGVVAFLKQDGGMVNLQNEKA